MVSVFCKEASFWVIGIITLIYVFFELAVALWFSSLTLLSDGFHNFSDVVSLGIAFWASKASRRARSDEMSYGWARTEILGALTNGMFLLSLCLYTSLEAIPEIISPTEDVAGWYFVGVAAAGLAINTLGTVVFAITGQAHGHSHAGGGGHGHSHGGHGHSHGGHDDEEEDHGHSHGDKKKKKKHGHAHSESDDHGHSHGAHDDEDHGHGHGEEMKKKKKHGHGHSHSEAEDHDHDDHDDHGHGHGKKVKKDSHSHGGEEGVSLLSDTHGHSHQEKKKKKPEKKVDLNVRAVFLHYVGDMISSFFVLIAGILMIVGNGKEWVDYIDPVMSLLICGLILFTTWPLVKGCLHILLQSTPKHLDLKKIRADIEKISGIMNAHDFHAWQLTDGMIITSLHIVVEEGCDFASLVKKVKKILHKAGIHSTAIQPEYVPRQQTVSGVCMENCVADCKEDWCCKTPEVKAKKGHNNPRAAPATPRSQFDPYHEDLL